MKIYSVKIGKQKKKKMKKVKNFAFPFRSIYFYDIIHITFCVIYDKIYVYISISNEKKKKIKNMRKTIKKLRLYIYINNY